MKDDNDFDVIIEYDEDTGLYRVTDIETGNVFDYIDLSVLDMFEPINEKYKIFTKFFEDNPDVYYLSYCLESFKFTTKTFKDEKVVSFELMKLQKLITEDLDLIMHLSGAEDYSGTIIIRRKYDEKGKVFASFEWEENSV